MMSSLYSTYDIMPTDETQMKHGPGNTLCLCRVQSVFHPWPGSNVTFFLILPDCAVTCRDFPGFAGFYPAFVARCMIFTYLPCNHCMSLHLVAIRCTPLQIVTGRCKSLHCIACNV